MRGVVQTLRIRVRCKRLDIAQLRPLRLGVFLVVDHVAGAAEYVDAMREDLFAGILAVAGGAAHHADPLRGCSDR